LNAGLAAGFSSPSFSTNDSVETEEAIILNGAENKLAAGGGLRAIRKLKH
jgi:hypothetical protein